MAEIPFQKPEEPTHRSPDESRQAESSPLSLEDSERLEREAEDVRGEGPREAARIAEEGVARVRGAAGATPEDVARAEASGVSAKRQALENQVRDYREFAEVYRTAAQRMEEVRKGGAAWDEQKNRILEHYKKQVRLYERGVETHQMKIAELEVKPQPAAGNAESGETTHTSNLESKEAEAAALPPHSEPSKNELPSPQRETRVRMSVLEETLANDTRAFEEVKLKRDIESLRERRDLAIRIAETKARIVGLKRSLEEEQPPTVVRVAAGASREAAAPPTKEAVSPAPETPPVVEEEPLPPLRVAEGKEKEKGDVMDILREAQGVPQQESARVERMAQAREEFREARAAQIERRPWSLRAKRLFGKAFEIVADRSASLVKKLGFLKSGLFERMAGARLHRVEESQQSMRKAFVATERRLADVREKRAALPGELPPVVARMAAAEEAKLEANLQRLLGEKDRLSAERERIVRGREAVAEGWDAIVERAEGKLRGALEIARAREARVVEMERQVTEQLRPVKDLATAAWRKVSEFEKILGVGAFHKKRGERQAFPFPFEKRYYEERLKQFREGAMSASRGIGSVERTIERFRNQHTELRERVNGLESQWQKLVPKSARARSGASRAARTLKSSARKSALQGSGQAPEGVGE